MHVDRHKGNHFPFENKMVYMECLNYHDPASKYQEVASLRRKKGIEKRKERRERRNNTRISTAERINYINNISIT